MDGFSVQTAISNADWRAYSQTWEHGEQILFGQPDRIDQAVAKLAGPTNPGPSAYMVGFAGVGEQRVFAAEIALAARVIGSRYGTTNHTVLLVNDRRDLEAHPLATVSGLRRTLREIGNRMDRDRDVLFLVLSSHGSEPRHRTSCEAARKTRVEIQHRIASRRCCDAPQFRPRSAARLLCITAGRRCLLGRRPS